MIATAGSDFVIRIWDFQSAKHVDTLEGHSGEVCALAFVPLFPLMVSADTAGIARFWPVLRASEAHLRAEHPSFLLANQSPANEDLIIEPSDGRSQNHLSIPLVNVPLGSLAIAETRKCNGAQLEEVAANAAVLLFTGDERGDIKVYNIDAVPQELKLSPIPDEEQPPRQEKCVHFRLPAGAIEPPCPFSTLLSPRAPEKSVWRPSAGSHALCTQIQPPQSGPDIWSSRRRGGGRRRRLRIAPSVEHSWCGVQRWAAPPRDRARASDSRRAAGGRQ